MLRPLVYGHDSRRDIRSGSRLRLLATAILLTILGLVVAPAVSASASESGTIHSLVNAARASAGLPPLRLNAALDQVAANWANQLAASGQLAHNPSYAAQIPSGWMNAGENVAQGQPTGAAMHDAWMASPQHRANILGEFTDVGIAFLSAGGTTWGVEVFAAYPAQAPAPAPPAVAPEATGAVNVAATQQAAEVGAQQAAAAAKAAAVAQADAAAVAAAAAQQAAEADVALAIANAKEADVASELMRVENRVSADRIAAAMSPKKADGSASDPPAGYAPSPGSLVAVGLVVIAFLSRMLPRGPLRYAAGLR